jgi:hypothetical protein
MTIGQITIFSSISLLYMFFTCYRLFKQDNQREITTFEIILFSLTMILLILMTIQVNKFKKQLKCPEYEKLENVYRLKQ